MLLNYPNLTSSYRPWLFKLVLMHSVLHLEEVQQSAGFCYVVPPPMRREVEAPFHDWQLANFPIEVLIT